ncbi:hypothetical protein BD779DRAFT_1670876 [Infundibulicybe gibba]|nr:hypothetical protein BD779DRAFT_1670876 [Infundibulicybe gibba]
MAYEILGQHHIDRHQPIVLVGGMSSLRGDWERLARRLATRRPGVVTQQLLFLPYHQTDPTPLGFKVTHVILAGTLLSPLRDRKYGLKFDRTIPKKPRTREEKREIARPTLEATFDPQWVANPENAGRLNWWLDRQLSGRPTSTILMQARAMNKFDFTGLHNKLPKDMQFLVIHGELDAIVPPSCGQEILRRIPRAKSIEVGGRPGQVEHLNFGHHWYEYFDIQVWDDVVEYFLEPNPMVRL